MEFSSILQMWFQEASTHTCEADNATAANRENIDIKGAVFLTVKAAEYVTNLMVYVPPTQG